ncbi:MAG: acyl-CoA dehydrogenase family protein [Alphaproteobacteria bacterium]
MEFGLSQEQVMLQASVERFLADQGGLARTRKFIGEGEARAHDVLEGLAGLGVMGLIIPEAFGGVGLSFLDAAIVSEALGRFVTPAPYVGTAVLAPLALMRAGSEAQKTEWLPKLAAGDLVAGVALSEATGARGDAGVRLKDGKLVGTALFVIDYEADIFIVADLDGRLHLVAADAPGLTRTSLKTIDGTRPTGELTFEGVSAEVLAASSPAVLRELIDVGRVMFAADILGAAQDMLDQAVAYSKERKQFERAIATFQAVKHMCAEMVAALEPCRAMVWYAAYALDALPAEASVTACHAKAHLSEVGTFVARRSTEVHGGMGFTDLVGLHYWFKRIGFDRQILGGPQTVREDAARLQGFSS